MKKVVVIEENEGGCFEDKCEDLLSKGYEMKACNCGFANSENYDFCAIYHAVFVKMEG